MKKRIFNKKIKQKSIIVLGKIKNKDRKNFLIKENFGFLDFASIKYIPFKETTFIQREYQIYDYKKYKDIIDFYIEGKKFKGIKIDFLLIEFYHFYFDLLLLKIHYKKLFLFLNKNLKILILKNNYEQKRNK